MARLRGMLLAPRETFGRLRQEPRAAAVLALLALLPALAWWAFLSTQTGQQAWVDERVVTLESFGIEVTDASYAQLLRDAGSARYRRSLALLAGLPLGTAAFAGLVTGLTRLAGRRPVRFRQALAVVAHANVILIVRHLTVVPLGYTRESMSNPSNLAILFPMLDEGTFLARLLGSIDVFYLWWLTILAIGLGVLLERPARRIGAWLVGIYALAAGAIAAVISILSLE